MRYVSNIVLTPGKFYLSRSKEVWCCYRVSPERERHCVADCIRVSDSRIEYFYIDGKYDDVGKREHTLIEEYIAPDAPGQELFMAKSNNHELYVCDQAGSWGRLDADINQALRKPKSFWDDSELNMDHYHLIKAT